jgi:U6 snRNA-associated Sm-like protein LSm6
VTRLAAPMDPSDAPPPAQKNNPADFLKTILGRPVVVKLNSGVDYRGTAPHAMAAIMFLSRPSQPAVRCLVHHAGVLACLDGYMNIAMEQTEEYVNGQLKAKYGDTFIRGNNGLATRISRAAPRTLLMAARHVRRARSALCSRRACSGVRMHRRLGSRPVRGSALHLDAKETMICTGVECPEDPVGRTFALL